MSDKKEKDFKALRDLLLGIQTQLCATPADSLVEPFRGAFLAIKSEFDTMLGKMPPTEQVPSALEMSWQLQSLWSCFYSLNSMFLMLSQAQKPAGDMGDMEGQMSARVTAEIAKRIEAGELIAKDALPAKLQEQIAAMATAGEIVPKATVVQLCADARTAALAEGEKKVRDEIAAAAALAQRIAERKTQLQTAGLPLPDAAIEQLLGGTDEEFAAHQTRATAQLAEFGKRGLQLNADSAAAAKAWLPAAEFAGFLALADAIPGFKAGKPAAEPFAQGGSAPTGRLPFPV